jgi:hypothetical protein
MSPCITISTPRSRASGLTATAAASKMLAGPSALGSLAERIAPVKTMGVAVGTVTSRKNAVSSMISVPCRTTMPFALSSAAICWMRRARRSQNSGCMCSLGILANSSTSTWPTSCRAGHGRGQLGAGEGRHSAAGVRVNAHGDGAAGGDEMDAGT